MIYIVFDRFKVLFKGGSHCTGDARFYVVMYPEDARFYAVIELIN